MISLLEGRQQKYVPYNKEIYALNQYMDLVLNEENSPIIFGSNVERFEHEWLGIVSNISILRSLEEAQEIVIECINERGGIWYYEREDEEIKIQ